ncbi:MAG: hypothetical protein ACSLFM_14835, partial [Tepidiformaceae bacterium]
EDGSVRDAILKYGIEHPVLNDPDFAVWRTYGVNAWPTLVLIDPAGNLVGAHAGEGVYPLFQPIVASLVSEFGAKGEIDATPLQIDLEASAMATSVLSFPGGVLADETGGRLFIADTGHNRIVITSLTGEVRDVIGSGVDGFADGGFAEAAFRQPHGMALSTDGNTLYVADTRNHAVRAVDLGSKSVRTVAGTGRQLERFPQGEVPAKETGMASPWGVVLVGDTLYIGMAGVHQLWTLDIEQQTVSVFAGTSREGIDDGPRLTMATLAQPSGIVSDGQFLYWVDPESSSVRLVPIEGANGEVSTIVGTGLFDFGDQDGVGENALLEHPQGLALHEGDLYVVDTYNHKVKRVSPFSGEVKTVAGLGEAGWQDGPGMLALFDEPGAATVAGDTLFVADTSNHIIRTVDLTNGNVRTLTLTNLGVLVSAGAAGKVDVAAQTVAPGIGTLRVTFRAPAGYKLNSSGPAALELSSSDPTVVELSEETVMWSSSEPLVDLPIPVALSAGTSLVRVVASVPYCRDGEEALCFFERVEFEAPVRVADGAASGDIVIEYGLKPEGR